MRTSWKKLQKGFALHRHGEAKDRRGHRLQQSLGQSDELACAYQDMENMRHCYDSLLSAAAATANSAYEFSESLREMGACFLEKTAMNDDEQSGKVLLMLGKMQFELQKLVDNYRTHIFQTITAPSESLLSELRTVEEMKRQCDKKRSVYEHMMTRHRERWRLRSSRGESCSSQELQAAHDDYDEEATLFAFRLKSLKQGQSRSLLTQAARHHAAQLCLFRKALKSLETVEPTVKMITEQQHIDYHFSGLEDEDSDTDDSDDDDDKDNHDGGGNYNVHSDHELSFDYGRNDQVQNVVSTPTSLLMFDRVDITFPRVASVDSVYAAKENLERNRGGNSFAFYKELTSSSQSEPLSAGMKIDPGERFRRLRPIFSQKFHSYVLPTPVETKSSVPQVVPDNRASQTEQTILSKAGHIHTNSFPLDHLKNEKILENEKLPGPTVPGQLSVVGESNTNSTLTCLPPPLAEKLSSQMRDQNATSDATQIKRQAFSGPLMGKSACKLVSFTGSPTVSAGPPKLFSGPLLRTSMPRPSSSPKLSPNASPTFISLPKINELHELPRPPANLAPNSAARPSFQIGNSGPLVSKGQENPAANKLVSSVASPLPTPPQTVPRSFSIPSRGQRVSVSPVSSPLRAEGTLKMDENIPSPPLTPICLPNIPPSSPAS